LISQIPDHSDGAYLDPYVGAKKLAIRLGSGTEKAEHAAKLQVCG
jgi:hypothetical protein